MPGSCFECCDLSLPKRSLFHLILNPFFHLCVSEDFVSDELLQFSSGGSGFAVVVSDVPPQFSSMLSGGSGSVVVVSAVPLQFSSMLLGGSTPSVVVSDVPLKFSSMLLGASILSVVVESCCVVRSLPSVVVVTGSVP